MTTDELDRPLTAADVLFGSSADTPKALTSHIMTTGQMKSLSHLPRVTREAAAREAAAAAAGLLKMDLTETLVAGWREHREIIAAARRTLATPASKELVGLGAHRISTVQQPAVGILLDGRRVHTLQLGVSIIVDVTALVAGVSIGRLNGVHSGRCDIGVALTIGDVEVLTRRAHLELPGVKALRSSVRLLPASEYPDSQHPDSQHPDSQHPDSQFPAVELTAVPPTAPPHTAEHQDSEDYAAEHPSSGSSLEHQG